jgi:cytochrome c553
LWSGRPLRAVRAIAGERYFVTDFRLVRVRGAHEEELVLHDIADVQRTVSPLDRLLGTSTIVVYPRSRTLKPIVLTGIRRGEPLAALLELLSGEPHASIDSNAARSALEWRPRQASAPHGETLAAIMIVLVAMFGVVIGLHGTTRPVGYAVDDPIEPNGVKRSRAEIVQFMEATVMPWARLTLGRIKDGPERITCETCHGADADTRGWQMPAVAALPQPDLRDRGWEVYGGRMDAQMRNAIYGYLADSEKQSKAAYMREVVMPGMARLLHRPAYDFTQPYDYNRSRHALGCYHCHKVK